MSYAVETTDSEAVARYGRAMALGAQVAAATAFVDPEVLSIGRETLAAWAGAEPALAPYGHYFDDLFRLEAHTRSSEVEEVLGLASDVFSGPYVTYSALVDSDLVFRPAVAADGQSFEVTQGTIDEIRSSPDRALRRSGWESFADGYIGVQNALAATLGTAVKQAVFSTRVRRHDSTLSASLTEVESPNGGLRQPHCRLRGEPADVASLLGAPTPCPRSRAPRALGRRGAPRRDLARLHLRAERRVDLCVACSSG